MTGLFLAAHRGDLINTRRIIPEDLRPDLQTEFPLREHNRTRGHYIAPTEQESMSLPLEYRLSPRVIKIWNGLPGEAVEKASERLFERKLDDYMFGR